MQRTRRPARRSRPVGAWEPVWQGDGEGPASIVAGALESRGIPARIQAHRAIPHAYPGSFAGSTWSIYVPSDDAVMARQYLRDSDEGANVYEAGSGEREQVFTVRLAIVSLVVLAGVSALGALFLGWSA